MGSVLDSSDREALKARVKQLTRESRTFQTAVSVLVAADVLTDADWPGPRTPSGTGTSVSTKQDRKGGSLVRNLVISDDVKSMEEHILRAEAAIHPAAGGVPPFPCGSEAEARTLAELCAAVRVTVANVGTNVADTAWRLGIIERVSVSLLPLTRKIREEVSPQHIRCTPFEHVHIALVAAIVEALDWPDTDLPARLAIGAQVTGVLEPTNVWDVQDRPSSLGLSFLDLPHEQWNAWLAADIESRALRMRPDATECAASLWEKCVAELDRGLCDGPWDAADLDALFGRGCWRAMRRFAVVQNGSVRACDDAAESLHNAGTSQTDKLRTAQADFPARVARLFHAAVPRDAARWSLVHGTMDLESAYRRVLTAAPGYCVVALWDPTAGRVRFLTQPGYNFGLVSAVTFFNAVPAALISACRRLLGVPCTHYFDDVNVCTLAGAGDLAQAAVGTLFATAGFRFSEVKHVPVAQSTVFLGVQTSFHRLADEGVVVVGVTDKRRTKLVRSLRAVTDYCSPAEAQVLAGKL